MEINFIGPLGKVTGSCTWMRDEEKGWNFLIDCGIQQGEMSADGWNEGHWPFDPSELKFVLLTHAHVDHCGLIPLLYKRGFEGTVYCTKETAEIATVLLKDAVKFSNNQFTASDVDKIKWHEPRGRGMLLNEFHCLDKSLFVRFQRTGHVIGAVSIQVYWGPKGAQKSIVFSGDVGPGDEDNEPLPFLRFPMKIAHPSQDKTTANYAVIESTYGGTIRDGATMSEEVRRRKLSEHLDHILKTKGVLVIPAFSFGRTQDVLYDLHWLVANNPERYESINYLLDSPTAVSLHGHILKALNRVVTTGRGKVRRLWLSKQFFHRHGLDDSSEEDNKHADAICKMVLSEKDGYKTHVPVTGNAVSRYWKPIMMHIRNRGAIALGKEGRPTVLVVSSGSCDGGPAAYWLPKILTSEDNTVLLSGYASPSSLGGKLLSLKDISVDERRRHTSCLSWGDYGGVGVPYAKIEASIDVISGYSAHADQSDLVNLALTEKDGGLLPIANTVFIQHGTDSSRRPLREALMERAIKHDFNVSVELPDIHTGWVDLDGADASSNASHKRQLEKELARIQNELLQCV